MTEIAGERRFVDAVQDALAPRLGVDERALASLRIALGALILIDLLRRARHLRAFYTDDGVVPRSVLADAFPVWSRLTVHTVSGEAWVQALLFAIAGLIALSLLVGYRTKLATLLSLLFLISLHGRNPALLNGGDTLLRHLLFWSLFLPLGERWSVDAVHGSTYVGSNSRSPRQLLGPATAGLLLQVFVVYATNAVLKLRGDLWAEGTAMQYVFEMDRFVVLLGDVLAAYPAVLAAVDRLWLALLIASPLLLLVTGSARALLTSLFVAAHLGMLLTMQLGIFPLISVAGLLPFLPGVVWDRLPTTGAETRLRRLPLERLPDPGRAELAALRERVRPIGRGLAALFVLTLLWLALVGFGYAPAPDGAPEQVTEPTWNMFAPDPPREAAWLVLPADLESGEEVDALRRSEVRWDRPPDTGATAPDERWRKLLYDLPDEEPALREPLARYLCSQWNETHDNRMVSLEIHYLEQPIGLDGEAADVRREQLGTYSCPS